MDSSTSVERNYNEILLQFNSSWGQKIEIWLNCWLLRKSKFVEYWLNMDHVLAIWIFETWQHWMSCGMTEYVMLCAPNL